MPQPIKRPKPVKLPDPPPRPSLQQVIENIDQWVNSSGLQPPT